MKNIKVSEKVWEELMQMKIRERKDRVSDVIEELLRVNEKTNKKGKGENY